VKTENASWQETAVAGLIVAAVTPADTPSGYNWTFLFPMLLFIVITAVLYYLFGRPHQRVPQRPIAATAGARRADPATAGAAPADGGPGAAAAGRPTASRPESHAADLAGSAGGTPHESAPAAAESQAADDGGASSDGEAHE
jgi:hypothetical protein